MIQAQYEMTPINLDKAEFIISIPSTKSNGAFKFMMLLLREIEDQLEARQKKNKIFYQVVHAIEYKYRKKIMDNQQHIQQIQCDLNYIIKDNDAIASRRICVQQELEELEEELNEMREYAEQRRNKKSKRERQYHQLYHVPLIAAQYKKKYVRARDKNLDAEEKLSEIRTCVDASQGALNELARALAENQSKSQELMSQQQSLEKETKDTEELVFKLHEACKFWQSFDENQALSVQKATTQFIETIQKYVNALQKVMNPNQDFIKFFKLALLEYGEAERYAVQRWGQLQVEYECAKCHNLYSGWPKPDKVRTSDLLCDSCYQEHRTSMIWEKKITGVKDKSQQLLSLPSNSRLSFSSTNSSNDSGSPSSSSKKPGFKKMFQLLKGNKRNSFFSNSSSSSLSSSSFTNTNTTPVNINSPIKYSQSNSHLMTT
ncbi:uncharacterized protein BX663DRAFT_511018 [Cokeromyces recurvatus]|uniref:uncharacterized protein n=1 Tax=Cokeromyces recurvatus TaxID=90255 RepID=UPI00221EDB6C|nr:uncharacterized protein BX663DRAFT_511018 [Cokeromyces recurvatus]KAI7902427.1 hypothetical protein BX663DRAFT_511018 [Cokeromyces recurvatus]